MVDQVKDLLETLLWLGGGIAAAKELVRAGRIIFDKVRDFFNRNR